MAVPGSGTAPLNNPDHRAEHDRVSLALYNEPRGIVAYQLGTAAGLALSNAGVALYTLTNVSLQAGRCYLLGFSVRAIQLGPFQSGGPSPRTWFTTNPMRPTNTSLVVDAYVNNVFNAAYDHLSWEQPFIVKYDLTIPTLQIMAAAVNGTTVYLEYGGHMRIEDIGADNVGRVS